MESGVFTSESKKFASPEEEIKFLREEVGRREQALTEQGKSPEREAVVADTMHTYAGVPAEKVLEAKVALPVKEAEAIVLDLTPEPHDKQIEAVRAILQEKGVRNAFTVVEGMKSPHLYDDFHRFLVQYIKEGLPVKDLSEKSPLWRPLHMTLFEVSLPDASKEDAEKEIKKLIAGMEQFFSGMLSVAEKGKEDTYFTLEIANANGSDEAIFYISVPDTKRKLFEKQIMSLFHNAKIREMKDDYNIFNDAGVSVASFASFKKNPIYPLKAYDEFEVDPLNVVLHSFSKIDREGEGAAIQFVMRPPQHSYTARYEQALRQILKGVRLSKALDIRFGLFGSIIKSVTDVLSDDEERLRKRQKEGKETPKTDEVTTEEIKKKISSPMLECGIRIIASSQTKESATEILSDVEASFNQFNSSTGNALKFTRVEKVPKDVLMRSFSLRSFEERQALPITVKELSTMAHFPATKLKSAPALRQAKAGTAPVPTGLPDEGLLLGVNRVRGSDVKIYMTAEDRLRHFYTIGQTGTGKTTFLKNMIAQDIVNGDGLCFIDPHGVDIQDVIAMVPPERYEDVIYFDPANTERPMGLNMLEYDARFPEQKTFVVNEMLSIFDKLFDMKTSGGPMFEQYFRNAVLLTIEDPESGSTLLDVSRVLANADFRAMKLTKCKNPVVNQFWNEVAGKAGGEASLANIVPYITSKFDNFLSNEIMRPIVAQQTSAFNFREIMDTKKILLVNLAKGRLGDLNANLIGLILVGKMLMAALSRVDGIVHSSADIAVASVASGTNPDGATSAPGVNRTAVTATSGLPPFYLYIDEFQNITTPSISSILSEARKYKLGLIIAHQFIKQLDEKIKDAVFGNVGSMAMFRVGTEDAEFLAKQLEPVFTESDLINLDNRNAYMKLLVAGRPVKPFSLETVPPMVGKPDIVPKLKELSALKFGRSKADVEEEIMAKYQK